MTKKVRFRSVADILDAPSAIASLLRKNRQHAALLGAVRRRLPAFLAAHCLACINSGGLLVVFTDSPVWATQLRFALPGLLGELRAEFDSSLRQVQVRVRCHHDPAQASRPAPVPNPSIIRQVHAAAVCCTSPELRAALLRLTGTWSTLGR